MSLSRSKTFSISLRDLNKGTTIKETLEQIKKDAYNTWNKPDLAETTYSHFFVEPKIMNRESQLKQENRNRPHPPLVFLTTRLRSIPGYFNSKSNFFN